MPDDVLEDELRAIGRRLELPPAPDPARVASAVRGRIAGGGPRSQATWRWLRYAAATVLIGFAVLVATSSQVRAAIAEFLRFGGVVVEQGADTGSPPQPTQPSATVVTDVAAARALVPFPVGVPAELGAPDEVTVVDRRVVSFAYHATGVRIDQFDGAIDYGYVKRMPDLREVQWTEVGGAEAMWLPKPHEIAYVDRTGRRHTESARLAAHTLVWQRGDVTVRLEGPLSRERAVEIAESLR